MTSSGKDIIDERTADLRVRWTIRDGKDSHNERTTYLRAPENMISGRDSHKEIFMKRSNPNDKHLLSHHRPELGCTK